MRMILVVLAIIGMALPAYAEDVPKCVTHQDVTDANPSATFFDLSPAQVSEFVKDYIDDPSTAPSSIAAGMFRDASNPLSGTVWLKGFNAAGCLSGTGHLTPDQFVKLLQAAAGAPS